MLFSLGDLEKLWGKPITPIPSSIYKKQIHCVFTDSRRVVEGSFFVPLNGERFDGHNFLQEAYKRGAIATVVANIFKDSIPDGFIYWKVQDTLYAYQQLAQLYRKKLNIPVIAITGSVGKTTTRELIKATLTNLGEVTSTQENNNNDVGVPLTLFNATSNDAALVVEMGMRGLGQIKRLSKCALPDMAVITNIGNAHIGLLGSRENIAIAKCEITSYLNPNGMVVMPEGDNLLEDTLTREWKGQIVRVGLRETPASSNNLNILSKCKPVKYFGQLDLAKGLLVVNGETYVLPLEGKHNAMNFMLALAVAFELGLKPSSIRKMILSLPAGRNSLLKFGNLSVLDETYNASPESVLASLDLLVTKPGRRFAVLGTMMELGDKSMEFHSLILEKAVELQLEGVVLVSKEIYVKQLAKIGKNLALFHVVGEPEEAFILLASKLKAGDNLLLKGSRKVGLERLLPLLKSMNL
ncbi:MULTISPECIES: UDP-N-acetylmuramoyl-tripeptide--D-alanyl-D-alanine ligase [Prochlorococcus]|uniref:UDP-N-acetylmuramoyl-tripeptide--D-alanyl-D- alanine ligase n=1 Tax=Prochlorococcus TaxID=1218 RepID=UPI000533BC8B|nr:MULTISPECIES: UDP-N-acetylmuramoyl-tripeptide--D-alanyl-D-alanine ligase [Prochlorococcus]KGG12306.1 UDP-N-acetylmuramoylalanyl-D-glutamyl-2,6- diaminopimelate--D-alanyl-D-alanine ligase [Prochlorococcus sp. MIT 0601]